MYYHYEIYTKHPETKESGWDIECGWVKLDKPYSIGCNDKYKNIAKQIVKKHYPLFDEFVEIYLANPNANQLEEDTVLS